MRIPNAWLCKVKIIMKYKYFLFLSLLLCSCKRYTRSDIPVLESTAESAYQHNDYSLSADLYTDLIHLDSTKDLYYFRRGVANDNLKHYKEAITDYKTSISLGGGTAHLYRNLGMAYEDIREYDSCIQYLNKSFELDSTQPNLKLIIKAVKTLKKLRSPGK